MRADRAEASPPTPQPLRVQDMRARWRAALAAAETALAEARGYLRPEEVRARGERLTAQRAEVRALLRALARERGVVLLSADEARRILGLPSSVQACVFALDGVLVPSATVHAEAWKQTFDPFLAGRAERVAGYHESGATRFEPFDPDAEYREHVHDRPRVDGVRTFLASRGIRLPEGRPTDPPGRETVHGLANRKGRLLAELLRDRPLGSYDNARRYLDCVRDAGIRSAVVSASAHTGEILARAGLAELVDSTIDAEALARERLRGVPAPERLLAACHRLGVPSERAVLYETTTAGVAAGRAAGFRLVVAIDRSETPAHVDALRAEGADLVAHNLGELLHDAPPPRA